MSKLRSTNAKFLFSLFILFALYISALFGIRNYTKVFIGFMTFGCHAVSHYYCAIISSFRFSESDRHYFEIKNKLVRKIFVCPISIDGVKTASKNDKRTSIIGFILNIINIVLFLSFEVLLLLPEISCEPYTITFVIGTQARNYEYLELKLDSLNEIIPAEGARAYFFIMALVLFAFIIVFEHKLKKHRQKIERNTARTPRRKPFKNTEWYSPLYTALVDLSDRRNNKKHKFWYKENQLGQIENLVKSASANAELKLETRGNKLASFTVVDTLNKSVRFTGYFI